MITGGESLVTQPPSFSNDGKKLLVCTGNTVSIYSTTTGLLVTELEGHKADVTCVLVVPSSSNSSASKILCYCWTSSLDGTIRYWDFSAPELIRKVDIRLPVYSMVIPDLGATPIGNNGKQSDLFAFVSVQDKNKADDGGKNFLGQIRKCNLTKSSLVHAVLTETRDPNFITISASGEYFGIHIKRKILVWKIFAKGAKHDVKKIKLHHTKSFSVLAFHPNERILAAGDVSGRILIWRGFGNKSFSENEVTTKGIVVKNEEERPGVRGDDDAESCSTWHWHSNEVKVLSFSSDGSYLYSGGSEGVFVVWQLETGKKRTLPRIGAPLRYFTASQDPSLSSVSCANNRIHLLKMPSMEIMKSISGIELPYSFPEIYQGYGFAFDHTAGLVALRTESYGLQFYSLFDNREVSQIQVCERNHQPNEEVTLVLTLTALSMDGSKLSTAEVKLPEEGIGGLVCLKFWDCGSRTGEFILSTVIYEPHRFPLLLSLNKNIDFLKHHLGTNTE
ncbi:Wd repeat-containing protein [Thalictrum thalictroides]|uniref:Wd repeat-containing protein n=1 Tax=Thalictrum thalictroides TaxID=46969 RepID=A0A7J6X199_THATH|nr:Wd repeat-containing protein [Thalictrum thalictroides]